MSRYDAVLLVSFGGPEGPDDVVPFLQNVTGGRGIPPERLAEVGEHYQLFGGVSPINAQNRALLGALRERFAADGIDLPVYWGNRNWAPYLDDVVREMRDDGVRKVLAFVTAAYSSYSGCRQYRENLADAVAAAGGGLEVDKVRQFFDHPGFVEPFVDSTVEALGALPDAVATDAPLVFTTHSVPTDQADRSGPPERPPEGPPEGRGGAYVAQHRAVAAEVARRVAAETGREHAWDLVYQSRSGPPSQPWLEPDVSEHLEQLAAEGVAGVVLVPIGFVSDHVEVVYDLDVLAAETASELGVAVARAATPGTDPRFVAMVVDLVRERLEDRPREQRAATTSLGPWRDVCVAACCPNPRGSRPAVAGQD